jgi:protein-L-isoaspartate(D-aspartate) O-methyltransferase
LPQGLVDQLRDGCILIAPVGPISGVQSLARFRKKAGAEGLERDELMPVRFVPLVPGKAAAL